MRAITLIDGERIRINDGSEMVRLQNEDVKPAKQF